MHDLRAVQVVDLLDGHVRLLLDSLLLDGFLIDTGCRCSQYDPFGVFEFLLRITF